MSDYLKNKKVIFVTNILGNGGAGRVMATIANYLAHKKYNVEILSFLDNYETYDIHNEIKNKVIYCKSKNSVLKKIERIMRLRKIIKANKEAVIISFEYFVNMQTIVATLGLKNKVIISERNDPSQQGNRFILDKMRGLLYRFADILVCQTEDAKNYFSKEVQRKSTIILNPIMPNLPQRFVGSRKKEIVTFCRIEPQKNLKMMIDAFVLLNKEHPEYTLSIYGDGSKKEELIEYVKSIGYIEKVNFYGFINNIHSKIVDKAMFVSSSDYEGISNSMIEALGIGLPSVLTDCPCGGARMIIKHNENGILVPVRDTNELYKGMKKIIEDNEFSKRLSQNAEKIKYQLNEKRICEQWIEIIL